MCKNKHAISFSLLAVNYIHAAAAAAASAASTATTTTTTTTTTTFSTPDQTRSPKYLPEEVIKIVRFIL